MNRKEFADQVYELVRNIPRGNVATYGLIAFLCGYPRHSRMVGQALHHTPDYLHVPCHRVVNSQGRLAPGWAEQKQLLANEGIRFKDNGCVDLKKYLWDVNPGINRGRD